MSEIKKDKPGRNAPEEVDAYLKEVPIEARLALQALRSFIKSLVPNATERVSYGIPIFRLEKDLIGISGQKNHCAIHTMSPALASRLKPELIGFKVSGATVHFQPDKPIPEVLVKLIVDARMEELAHR